MPQQSTFRRYYLVTALMMSVIFASTIAYMTQIHAKTEEYAYMQELERRVVSTTLLLEMIPVTEAVTSVIAEVANGGTTSNAIAFREEKLLTANSFAYASSNFPYTTSLYSPTLNGTVTVTDNDMQPRTFSCRPLVVGEGLCLLLCFLAVQIGFLQAGNLLAQQGKRIIGIAFCWLAHFSGIAFIVGTVVLIGVTQRSCSMYSKGEAMRSTIDLLTELTHEILAADVDAATVPRFTQALSNIEQVFGDRYALRFASSTFPSSLTYYQEQLGGGIAPQAPYLAFNNNDGHELIVATNSFVDNLDVMLWYISTSFTNKYIFDEDYAIAALTLGIVPLAIVALAAGLLLPYPALGSLESGSLSGVFPSQWRMSNFSGPFKFLHFGFIVVVVISMSTIGLDVSFANRAVSEAATRGNAAYESFVTSGSAMTTSLIELLISVIARSYGTTTTAASLTALSPQDDAIIDSFYTTITSQTASAYYNTSSVADQLNRDTTAATAPMLSTSAAFAKVFAAAGNTSTSRRLQFYAALIDRSFAVMALTGNATTHAGFQSIYLAEMKKFATTLGVTALFDTAWAAYAVSIASYVAIANNLGSQTYNDNTIKALYSTAAGRAAHIVEDQIISSSTSVGRVSQPSPHVSAPNAHFQIYTALSVVLPAIILLSCLAMWDTFYTHYFFALLPKTVPTNDPTAIRGSLKIDRARLQANMRFIAASGLVLCFMMVILYSILYAQTVVNASLQYEAATNAVTVASSRQTLLFATGELVASTFEWTRALMSRNPDDISSAVKTSTHWINFLMNLYSTWSGKVTGSQRDNLIAQVAQMGMSTREFVLGVALTSVAPVSPYDYLADLFNTQLEGPFPDADLMLNCIGSVTGLQTAQAFLGFAMDTVYNNDVASKTIGYQTAISTAGAKNNTPICAPINVFLNNAVAYIDPIINLRLIKLRRDKLWLSTHSVRNTTNTVTALEPFKALTPEVVQQSSHYSLFWVPVLLGWLALPLGSLVYRRTFDTSRSVNFSA